MTYYAITGLYLTKLNFLYLNGTALPLLSLRLLPYRTLRALTLSIIQLRYTKRMLKQSSGRTQSQKGTITLTQRANRSYLNLRLVILRRRPLITGDIYTTAIRRDIIAFLSYASNITNRFLGKYNRVTTAKRIQVTLRHFPFNITLLFIVGYLLLLATALFTLVILILLYQLQCRYINS